MARTTVIMLLMRMLLCLSSAALASAAAAEECASAEGGQSLVQLASKSQLQLTSAEHSEEATELLVGVQAKLTSDAAQADVSFQYEGRLHKYTLEGRSLYSKDGAVHIHTADGEEVIRTGLRMNYVLNDARQGQRASAFVSKDGEVSGIFHQHGVTLVVEPASEEQQAAAGLLQSEGQAHLVRRAPELEALRKEAREPEDDDDDDEPPHVDDIARTKQVRDPEDDDDEPPHVDLLSKAEGKLARVFANSSSSWNGAPYFPGCYPHDTYLHILEVKLVADDIAVRDIGGSTVQGWMEGNVRNSNYMYMGNFDIEIKIKSLELWAPNSAGLPDYAKGSCSNVETSMTNQATKGRGAGIGSGLGAAMIFTGCGDGTGVTGLAWVGQVCSSKNVGAKQARADYKTFAHELGHIFGADDAWDKGKWTNGQGIMGYGDKKYHNQYQFNPEQDLNNEICAHLTKKYKACAGFWPENEDEITTSTTTTTTTLMPADADTAGGWYVASGPCRKGGEHGAGCISSPHYPDQYGNNERCNIVVIEDTKKISVPAFSTRWDDDLTINGQKYAGLIDQGSTPADVVPSLQTIVWTTGASNTRPGFVICRELSAGEVTTTTTLPPGGWYVASGDCGSDGAGCITSPGFTAGQEYGNNERCEIGVVEHTIPITVESWSIRWDDSLIIDGNTYTGGIDQGSTPANVVPTSPTIVWTTAASSTRPGFKICRKSAGTTTTTTTTTAAPASSEHPGGWYVSSGLCQSDSNGCITSPHYPQEYGNSERCEIEVVENTKKISVDSWSCRWDDHLWINGNKYTGLDGQGSTPADVVPSLQTIVWTTGASSTRSGWKICRPP